MSMKDLLSSSRYAVMLFSDHASDSDQVSAAEPPLWINF